MAYLPWMVVLVRQVMMMAGDYWIAPITLDSIMIFIKFPFVVGNDILSLLLLVLFAGMGVHFLLRKKEANDWYLLFAPMTAAGVLGLGLLISFLIRPFYCNHYLFPTLGLFWLFFAVEASKLNKKIIWIIAALMIVMGAVYYQKEWKMEYIPGVEDVMTFMDTEVGEEDVIINSNSSLHHMIEFYNAVTPMYEGDEANLKLHPELEKELEKYAGTKWYIFTAGDEAHMESYTEAGYKFIEAGDYNIEGSKFKIYKIEK